MTKQEIIDYIMTTPSNSNLAVLKSMLGDGDWEELLDYVRRTSYRMNRHVLDGLLGASSKKDTIVLLDGTYVFEQIPIGAQYITTLEKSYNPTNVTVTIDGVTVELPKVEGSTYPTYGEFNENHRPTFNNYPVLITINNDTHQLAIAASETGSHTIKITVPNGSEVVV